MQKQIWKPGTMLYPLPAVMVSCGAIPEEFNIITISWTGTICSNPPMCYISVRPERHSYDIIKKNMDFVINLTNKELAYAADFCGVKTGKEINKFEAMKLTPAAASIVKAPIIEEAPVNIECVVKQIQALGSHDMFIAEVVAVQVDEHYINQDGHFDMQAAELIAYSHGFYYQLGQNIGRFGYSVMKKKAKK